MAEKILDVKIKQRYDTEANWKSSNPLLLEGEMAVSSDKNNQYKIGDGTSKWNDLSYSKAEPVTHEHNKIKNMYASRPASADIQIGDGSLYQFKATSSMTTSKPAGDGEILHMAWDNNGGYDSQLFVGNFGKQLQTRGQNKGVWSDWCTYLNSDNYLNYPPNKLSAARTITASGDMTGSFAFDGSANVSYNLYPYYAAIQVGNTNNYPFHRFAYLNTVTGSYQDRSSTFLITQDYYGGGYGIVKVTLRTNNANSVSTVSVEWLVRKGLEVDSVQAAIYNVYGETYADVFFKTRGAYASAVARNLASGTRGNVGRTWILVNSSEASDTTASDQKTSKECFSAIDAAGTTLHGKAYSASVAGVDSGTVKTAASASSATKSTQDSSGQQINSTYIKGISVSGNTLTYTKGNGATAAIDLKQPPSISYATFTASGWAGSSAPYTQTVSVSGITSNDEPLLIQYKEPSMTAASLNAYNKAFAILADGFGETSNGSVTWTCLKKPAADIKVGFAQLI